MKKVQNGKAEKNGALLYGNEVWWMKIFLFFDSDYHYYCYYFLVHGEYIRFKIRIDLCDICECVYLWMWMKTTKVQDTKFSAATQRASEKKTHTQSVSEKVTRERERSFSFSKNKTSTKMTCTISECLQNNITIFLWIEWKWNITQGINSSRIMAHTHTHTQKK